jgi:hypothetical protein
MDHQQGIIKGDSLQKLGSAGFIIGATLLVIFNVLIPRVSDPSNVREMLKNLGEQEVLAQICFLLLAVGIWGAMIGVTGVYRSISAGGAAWARLGFYGIVVGTTLWTITFALGMATACSAASWIVAPTADKATAYSVAVAVSAAQGATETMCIIVYWLALVFLGIGMVLSAVYPKWMGWVLVFLGIATVVAAGVIPVFTGPASAIQFIFMILSLLSTIWILVVGIWIARKVW